MKHIVLCPNPYKDAGLAVTREARAMLTGAGHGVRVCPELLEDDPAELPPGLECSELFDALEDAALVVSLGGDGTIMHTARRMAGHRVPIIGVNLGTVGFLAELERSELHRLLDAAAGNFTVDPRMMLHVALERRGETVYECCALNDVYLHGVGRMLHMTARGDGRKILEFSGDGVVIASPTGSTAYSMSAGGPLVEPSAENLILTPVCPHALAARSFVLAPDREVTVTVGETRHTASVSADGEFFEARGGDVLRVKKAEHKTLIAHVGDKGFYDIVYEKLGDRK